MLICYLSQIYKEMKVDFKNKFEGQRTAPNPYGLNQPKIHNKFAYVQGYTTNAINSQIKTAAKAVHKSNQAAKTQGIVSKAIGPVVNGLYTGTNVKKPEETDFCRFQVFSKMHWGPNPALCTCRDVCWRSLVPGFLKAAMSGTSYIVIAAHTNFKMIAWDEAVSQYVVLAYSYVSSV